VNDLRASHRRPWPRLRRAVALAGLLLAGLAEATGGAYGQTGHGDAERGVLRLRGVRRGDCRHCHARQAGSVAPAGKGQVPLFAQNDNQLCLGCHRTSAGSFPGGARYAQSVHGQESGLAWPGPLPPARPSSDAGKCLNCHDPHGVRDAAGVIPGLLPLREEALCAGCHDGSRGAADIAGTRRLAYHHPSRPTRPDSSLAAVPAPSSGERSARREGCSACHNPHRAGPDTVRPRPPAASARLAGAPRVRLVNGLPGSEPIVAPRPGDDGSPAYEYETCFTCHAGAGAPGTGLRAGGRSVAAQLNPANASFHAVMAPGRTATIDRKAFVNGWSADRQLHCADCHSGDEGRIRGPHGSSFAHLLTRRYQPEALGDRMLPSDLCFQCHAWASYGDPAGGLAHTASRFQGHASHVGRGASCWACHESHGSTALPSLLALRMPGLTRYQQDDQGGSCTVTCHAATPATSRYAAAYRR
jgi:predicted CXXCH cytochrome family protein